MPIIKSKKDIDLSSIRAKLNPVVLEQIESYCQWAGIYDLGYFFEKAATELLLKDVDWLLYQRQVEESTETIA